MYEFYARAYAKNLQAENELVKSHQILQAVMESQSQEETNEILKNSEYTMNYLKGMIRSFLRFNFQLSKEEFDETTIKLETAINSYMSQKQQESKEKREAEKQEERAMLLSREAQILIPLFIESKCTVKEFKAQNPNLEKCVKYAEEFLPDLYALYRNKTISHTKQNYAILNKRCQSVLDGIKNGVQDEFGFRAFNLIDFYQIFRGTFEEFLRLYQKSMSPSDLRVFRKFMSKYTNDRVLTMKELLALKIEVDVQKDKDGILIPGSGRMFTTDEKLAVVELLKQSHIPVTLKTFHEARNMPKNTLKRENTM